MVLRPTKVGPIRVPCGIRTCARVDRVRGPLAPRWGSPCFRVSPAGATRPTSG